MMWRDTAIGPRNQKRAATGIVRRRRPAITLAAVLVVITGACGGDDDDDASADSTAVSSTSVAVSSDTSGTASSEAASAITSDDEISGSAASDTSTADDTGGGDDTSAGSATSDETAGEAATSSTTLLPPSTIEPGNINQTVPGQPQPTEPPVAIDEPAETESGVTARITAVKSVETKANLPGEIGGPGVAITIELRNGSSAPIDLNNVVVDLVLPGDVSATPITEGSEPFTGVTAAGATQAATYVFTVDASERGDVTIRLSYSADQPVVVFAGSIA